MKEIVPSNESIGLELRGTSAEFPSTVFEERVRHETNFNCDAGYMRIR